MSNNEINNLTNVENSESSLLDSIQTNDIGIKKMLNELKKYFYFLL